MAVEQADVSQDREVLRDVRLPELGFAQQLRDGARAAAAKDVEDPEMRCISQRLEAPRDRSSSPGVNSASDMGFSAPNNRR